MKIQKIIRNNIGEVNTYLIILLIFLNALWLPTFGFWGKYPSTKILGSSDVGPAISFQHPLQPKILKPEKPQLQAESYILVDVATNTILLSKNPHSLIYPASTTKLATALTALNIYPLDEVITVDEEYREGKVMELKIGEKITVKSLVSSILIFSANDAAFTLAKHHPNGISGFIDQMNQIAQKYGLNETNFVNYDGIHHPEHFSSVYDLAQLGRLSVKNGVLKDTVKTKQLMVTDTDGQITHDLISTNELLGVQPEIEGLKTGWTPEAGGCFVGLVNTNGKELISVVAQSPDRFSDTQKLVDWAKSNISWEKYQP